MVYRTEATAAAELLSGHLKLGGYGGDEEISVNSRYFTRNGRPWIPIMGEMHYVRVPKAQWRETLSRMKAGGITVVSAYVIWIYHEEREGIFDFSGNKDLRGFVQTAKECGLSVALRVGPWVHGEVRNGGFPDWLLKKGIPLRCNDPEYLSCTRSFFSEIEAQVRGLLFKDGGPIFAIQLENELTGDAEHLRRLKELAIGAGLTVPVYTVTGWNAKNGAKIPQDEVIPVFGGYVEAPWEQHTEKLKPSSHWFFLPDRNDSGIGNDLISQKDEGEAYRLPYDRYPFATCELGGGIQPTYHRRPLMGDDDVAAAAMVALGCGNNLPGYYMYRGGVNRISKTTLQESRATGYPNDYPIINYDFQAPIGSWGQTRSAYRKLKIQHLFLQCFQEMLAVMTPRFQTCPPADREDRTSLRYCVRTDGKSGFAFVNNYQRLDRLAEHSGVQFEVPSGDGTIRFPENGLRVLPGAYFFLPYGISLGKAELVYATAQLLFRDGENWFFFSIPGIDAEYCIRDEKGEERCFRAADGKILSLPGCRIVTLTQEEAENFYAAGGEICVTDGAELFEEDGKLWLRREGDPDLSFSRWDGERFVHTKLEEENAGHTISVSELPVSEFTGEWGEELFLGGKKELRGWRISQNKGNAGEELLRISYTGDVLQIYADKKLADDDFYRGESFVTRNFLNGSQEVEIWISGLKEGACYLEQGEREGLSLKSVQAVPVYKKAIELSGRE